MSYRQNQVNHSLSALVYTQMWEFFSTYGMTALLMIYLTSSIKLSDGTAYKLFGSYMALLYASPLLADFFVDVHFRRHQAVIFGGLLMAVGHFLLLLEHMFLIYLSLSLMIAGFGLFTPALISLTGELKSKKHNHTAKFTLYYVGQNIGSLFAPIVCGIVGKKYGWGYGFSLAGFGMISGVAIFIRQDVLAARTSLKELMAIAKYALLVVVIAIGMLTSEVVSVLLGVVSLGALLLITRQYLRLNSQEKKNLRKLFFLMLFMMIFFSMLSQGGTSIILFLNRLMDKSLWGFNVPTPMLMSIESFFLILLAPLFIQSRFKISQLPSTTKYGIGLVVMACAFIIFSQGADVTLLTNMPCSIQYVIYAFLLFAIAELFIMPVGYAEIVRLAPKHMLGLMVATWAVCQSVARYLAQMLAHMAEVVDFSVAKMPLAGMTYRNAFINYALILLLASLSLFLLKRLRFLQQESI